MGEPHQPLPATEAYNYSAMARISTYLLLLAATTAIALAKNTNKPNKRFFGGLGGLGNHGGGYGVGGGFGNNLGGFGGSLNGIGAGIGAGLGVGGPGFGGGLGVGGIGGGLGGLPSSSGSCRYWCRTPQGQSYCCESGQDLPSLPSVKPGQCPPVRPQCPPTRAGFRPPAQCSNDSRCPGAEKCCFDTCL